MMFFSIFFKRFFASAHLFINLIEDSNLFNKESLSILLLTRLLLVYDFISKSSLILLLKESIIFTSNFGFVKLLYFELVSHFLIFLLYLIRLERNQEVCCLSLWLFFVLSSDRLIRIVGLILLSYCSSLRIFPLWTLSLFHYL